MEQAPVLSADAVRAAARGARFSLVGLARAEPLDPQPLESWLACGLRRRHDLDGAPAARAPGPDHGARGRAHRHRAGDRVPPPGRARRGAIARYARGRDYHYAHRDRMKDLRKRLLALDPTVETYASVDTGVAMEKPWAERAGLGWIGKNGCLINPRLGSWLTLSVMFVDRAVDAYDAPAEQRCGDCTLCLWGLSDRRVRRARRGRRAPLHRLPQHRAPGPGAAAGCGRVSAAGSSAATSARRSAPGTTGRNPRATPASRRGRCRRWPPPRSPRWLPTSSSGWRPAWRWRARATTACAGTRCTRSAPPGIGGARDVVRTAGRRSATRACATPPPGPCNGSVKSRIVSPCDRRECATIGTESMAGKPKDGDAIATETSGR